MTKQETWVLAKVITIWVGANTGIKIIAKGWAVTAEYVEKNGKAAATCC